MNTSGQFAADIGRRKMKGKSKPKMVGKMKEPMAGMMSKKSGMMSKGKKKGK
jgi:hypothetical protein